MEKEKMIEEMARRARQIINEDDCATRDNICQCQKCKYSDISFPDCQFWILADKLIEDNYRKIPEGAVILTKEEYDRFEETKNDTIQKKEEYIKGLMELKKEKENIRKDTATNFFKDLIRQANFHGETDMWFNYERLKSVAKQNGVEVKE